MDEPWPCCLAHRRRQHQRKAPCFLAPHAPSFLPFLYASINDLTLFSQAMYSFCSFMSM